MEEIKAELTAQLENPVAFTIPVLGGIPVSQSVVVSWIIIAALTLAAILLTRNLKPVPGRRQLVLEMFVGFMTSAGTSSARSGSALPPGWGRWPCTSPAPT